MIKGVDISTFQGDVNFDALKSAVQFVIARASYGTGCTDKKFTRNRDEARRVGLALGFYHYAYPKLNMPEAEADWFAQVVGTPRDGEFLVLDFEESYTDPVGWSKRFLDRLSGHYNGYKPLIYLNLSLSRSYNWKTVIDGNYGLWLAHYDNKPEMVDDTPWPFVAMKQYTSTGKVNGVAGNVDCNVFNGTLDQLKKYGYRAPVAPPQPPQPPVTPPVDPKDTQIAELQNALKAANDKAEEYRILADNCKNRPDTTIEKYEQLVKNQITETFVNNIKAEAVEEYLEENPPKQCVCASLKDVPVLTLIKEVITRFVRRNG